MLARFLATSLESLLVIRNMWEFDRTIHLIKPYYIRALIRGIGSCYGTRCNSNDVSMCFV